MNSLGTVRGSWKPYPRTKIGLEDPDLQCQGCNGNISPPALLLMTGSEQSVELICLILEVCEPSRTGGEKLQYVSVRVG